MEPFIYLKMRVPDCCKLITLYHRVPMVTESGPGVRPQICSWVIFSCITSGLRGLSLVVQVSRLALCQSETCTSSVVIAKLSRTPGMTGQLSTLAVCTTRVTRQLSASISVRMTRHSPGEPGWICRLSGRKASTLTLKGGFVTADYVASTSLLLGRHRVTAQLHFPSSSGLYEIQGRLTRQRVSAWRTLTRQVMAMDEWSFAHR
ncbi:Uncharacterised protein [Klebsiella pneumoniae]|nr:Uncharacterised protein [Klebsiella pneumoniae]